MNAPLYNTAVRSPYRAIAMAGFSLIEMMISITIGLVIVAALIGVLVGNSRNTKTNDRTSELQGNGRYALDHLKRELRHAGYRGYTWGEPSSPTTAIAVTNECLAGGAAGSFVSNIRQGIWGANDSNPYAADCLPGTTAAATYLQGDMLVIRRVASQSAATLAASTFYFRSSYSNGEVFQGTTPPATVTGTPIASFPLQEYVYYIGGDDNDATVPALRRVSLQANGMVNEMVVSGIEHLQVQYGIADTALNTQYFNANGIVGASTDTNTTDWDDVNSVRIWLLVRNALPETGYTNTSTYSMGDQAYTVNDSFRRQLFTTVVQLRN